MNAKIAETALAEADSLTQDYVTRLEQWIEKMMEVVIKEAKHLKLSFEETLTESAPISSTERFIKSLQEAYFSSVAIKYSSGRLKNLLSQDAGLRAILGRAIVKVLEYLNEKGIKGELAAELWEDPESSDEEVILNVYIPAPFKERMKIWEEIDELLNDIDPEFRIRLSVEGQR